MRPQMDGTHGLGWIGFDQFGLINPTEPNHLLGKCLGPWGALGGLWV